MQLKALLTAALLSAMTESIQASSLTRLAKRAPTCDEGVGTACTVADANNCYAGIAVSDLTEDEDGRQQCSGIISDSVNDCSCSCDCGDGSLFDSLQDFEDTFDAIINTCINAAEPGSNTYVGGSSTVTCTVT
ncbi:uncharacterized protein STEHIDRAFT_149596 [Stereum hirsutum FP-91666 SS1]|uniref:uncharacterized protein n=1 Tax=Stereum hirsutum (strain FP-91666) TaxID=721885 RepID=UPI000444A643|nr:uncharacterized protein STEHIDRAFT_149596 [Stereum hirsutum FP-91666 SS1]EIM81783.1 hypothetical protein STEHIDRAFT_149596 [Stereum hirsutum FP-91666 SS1]